MKSKSKYCKTNQIKNKWNKAKTHRRAHPEVNSNCMQLEQCPFGIQSSTEIEWLNENKNSTNNESIKVKQAEQEDKVRTNNNKQTSKQASRTRMDE